jgi:hypothetical protein
MHRLATTAAAALAAAALGCGAADRPLPTVCAQDPGSIERALRRSPAAVRLADGTPLSECIARARSDSDLQTAGLTLSRAADHLAQRAVRDAAAAVELGYLLGAARRGAARTGGIHAQLVRHLEQSAARIESGPPGVRAALRRGLAAGETTG